MLSKVLEKSTCAQCKFCCSFRRCSLWETPLFPEETVRKLEKSQNGDEVCQDSENKSLNNTSCENTSRDNTLCENTVRFDMQEKDGCKYGRMHLQDMYKTDDENEEVKCLFLDSETGCTLSYEDKPFDCKIWPLRIMKKDDEYVIALTPTCPAINKVSPKDMQKLVDDGLGEVIYDYAKKHPFIIKDYKEGFPVLMSRK